MARSQSISYDIGRPLGRCVITDEPIDPNERYVAALVDLPGDDALGRADVSCDAWNAGHRPDHLFAWWRATMPESGDDTPAGLKSGNLLELYDSLEDAEDPRRLAFRYVVALMLIRSRELKQVGVTDGDGGRALLIRRKGEAIDSTPEELPEPTLDREAVNAMVEQLRLIMDAPA